MKMSLPTRSFTTPARKLSESFFTTVQIRGNSLTAPMATMEFHPIMWVYSLIQWFLDKLLSPTPPPPNATLTRPRIAVIGAGLTGVSSAAHCIGHGFDVTIFEAGDEKSLGGIWSVSLQTLTKCSR